MLKELKELKVQEDLKVLKGRLVLKEPQVHKVQEDRKVLRELKELKGH